MIEKYYPDVEPDFYLITAQGWADGMMFSYEEVDQQITGQNLITENSRRVFLIHNSVTRIQKTVKEVRTGEAEGNFIWMIPIVNEEDISVEDFILTVKEETDCNSRFNSLSVQTGPKIIYTRHEVIEHIGSGSDMVFGCSCGMAMPEADMEGGTGDIGDSESVEENLPEWSSKETENFTVDMIRGDQ